MGENDTDLAVIAPPRPGEDGVDWFPERMGVVKRCNPNVLAEIFFEVHDRDGRSPLHIRKALEQVQTTARLMMPPPHHQDLPSLARLAVHGLTDEVCVAVVPGVLLNHVDENPAHTWRTAIRPGPLRKRVEATLGKRLSEQ